MDLVFLLQRGFTPEQMCTHYSDRPLTLAEVHSALAYYYDNTEEIEAYIRASDQWEEEFEVRKAEHLARRAGAVENAHPRERIYNRRRKRASWSKG